MKQPAKNTVASRDNPGFVESSLMWASLAQRQLRSNGRRLLDRPATSALYPFLSDCRGLGSRMQRLLQIGDNIVGVLNPDRQPDQAVADSDAGTLSGR
jgi:hypothetical protein